MKTYIVLTTINIPKIAIDLCTNFEKHNHKDEVGILIIGDKKSPHEESALISKKLQKKGFEVEYFDLKRQEAVLKKYQSFEKIIPYNSDNRRNVGFLLALKNGCQKIISIDDDNFPLPNIDFLEAHSIVGTSQKIKVVKSTSKWFNPLNMYNMPKSEEVFTRGFPYNKRSAPQEISYREKTVKIGLNMGLWVGDPDIDAITRISRHVNVKNFKVKQIFLELGTYAPINTQNTALLSELVPAYYFILMGEKIDGLTMDRFGDIWSGFFIKKVMDHLGYYVSIGEPLVRHTRNEHNLFEDLKQELPAIIYTDLIAQIIEEIKLKGESASALYSSLSDQLLKIVLKDKRFSADFKKYQQKLQYNQNIWLETIGKIQK